MGREVKAYSMVKDEIEKIIIDEYEKKKTPVQDIAHILNIIGYKTKSGKKFIGSNVSRYALSLGLTKRNNRGMGHLRHSEDFKYNENEINNIIKTMYNSGIQIKHITKELNKKGYKTKAGYQFNNSIVSKDAKLLGLKPRRVTNKNENTIINNTINEIVESEEVNNMGLTEQQDLQLIETSVITKNYELKTVQFNNVNMIAIKTEDGKIFTSIKKICLDIGIDERGQQQRILRDEILKKGACIIHVPSNENGNKQPTLCLDIEYLPFWLIGIQSNRCKEEVKSYLIEFKMKAQKILSDAFIKKEVPQQEQKTLTLSEMLLAQAQLNVDLEKKLSQVNDQMLEVKSEVSQFKSDVSQVNSQVSNLDQQVKQILEQKEEGLKKLDCIEYSETLPLFKTERTRIRQLVDAYAGAFNCPQRDVWNKLYQEFLYRYKRNIKVLAYNRKMKPLDFAESSGLMEDLYNLASNLLRV